MEIYAVTSLCLSPSWEANLHDSVQYSRLVGLRLRTLQSVGADAASWVLIGDLRAKASEQGLTLEELKQASEDAADRLETSHEEFRGMMVALLKISLERETLGKSGGQRSQPTAGAARRDASPQSSESSDGDGGSRESERVPAEADQLGRRGQDSGLGEGPSITHGGLGSRRFWDTQTWRCFS